MGAITRLFGILLLLGGVVLFIVGHQGVQQYQTVSGQIALLNPEAKEQYELYTQLRVLGGVAGVLGFVLALAGIGSSTTSTSRQPPRSATSNRPTSGSASAGQRSRNSADTAFCPSCGSEIQESDSFCYNCGTNVEERTTKPTVDHGTALDTVAKKSGTAAGKMNCPGCGSLNDIGNTNCTYCDDPL